tara:strand:+ start:3222 stop:3476 length:255 start_codon:yes stop_codon:yes gene_type:complete
MDSVDSKVFWETIAVVKSSGGVTEERGTLDSNTKKGVQQAVYKDADGIKVGEILREPPNPTNHYINYTYITNKPELWEKVKEVS